MINRGPWFPLRSTMTNMPSALLLCSIAALLSADLISDATWNNFKDKLCKK